MDESRVALISHFLWTFLFPTKTAGVWDDVKSRPLSWKVQIFESTTSSFSKSAGQHQSERSQIFCHANFSTFIKAPQTNPVRTVESEVDPKTSQTNKQKSNEMYSVALPPLQVSWGRWEWKIPICFRCGEAKSSIKFVVTLNQHKTTIFDVESCCADSNSYSLIFAIFSFITFLPDTFNISITPFLRQRWLRIYTFSLSFTPFLLVCEHV